MKKYILAIALLLGVANLVSAQTSLTSLLEQISRLSLVSQASKYSSSSTITPVTISPTPTPYTQGLPPGSFGQTLYHNGNGWVAAGNLLNDGQNVGIGVAPVPGLTLFVENTGTNNTAVTGSTGSNWNSSGIGVLGYTANGKAVEAQVVGNNGYGFYQTGSSTRNYFEGKVGIGTTNPQEKLDLGGGNIKMGYEIVTTSGISGWDSAVASCPVGKSVIGGGCNSANFALKSSYPVGSGNVGTGWRCFWQGAPSPDEKAYAICANIR